MLVYGERPRRTFREATAHYLKVNAAHKRISRDALALRELDPYIGTEWIDAIHDDSFTRYRRARRTVTASTRNRTIGVARRVLTQAARLWTYPRTSLTWLAEVPLIVMEKEVHARQAYPLDWYEQDLLLGELTTTVARMARFDVSTGLARPGGLRSGVGVGASRTGSGRRRHATLDLCAAGLGDEERGGPHRRVER